MSSLVNRRIGARYAAFPGVFFLLVPILSYADGDLPDELRRCHSIDDSSARLACYDSHSGRPTPAEIAPTSASEPQLQKAPDDLGSEMLPPGSRGEVEKLLVRATVIRCQKNTQEKNLFFFDNGQVWKQKSNSRRKFKDCSFDVTITQDFFGYKMQPDGQKGQIRISRIK
jgi:hypothetical protein